MRVKKILKYIKVTFVVTQFFGFSMFAVNNALAFSAGGIVAANNAQRAAVGTAALAYNQQLSNAASAKAQHMCTYNYWAHTAPDGTTGWYFIKQSGYSYTAAGENLAKGFSTDAEVVSGWMASSAHRSTMLSGTYKDVGVGYYQCGASVTDTIVVAMYAAPVSKPAPSPAPKPAPSPTPAPAPKPAAPAASTKPAANNQPAPTQNTAPAATSDSLTVTATVLPNPYNTPPAEQSEPTTVKKKSLVDQILDYIKKTYEIVFDHLFNKK